MTTKKITVITPNGKTVLNADEGAVLADVLSSAGFTVTAACGRKGTCGKCAVRLISGEFSNEKAENGMIRSCKATVQTDAVIAADLQKGSGLTDFTAEPEMKKGVCGIAVDIGTTTVAASLLKKDGSVVSRSCLNPQSVFGADVISRIEACSSGSLGEQTRLIRSCIKELTDELNTDSEAQEIVISGNTTMLHLFCGISPESMGVFPFTPQFTDVQHFDGAELGFSVKKVTVLPSVSAYIGSDIVSGIYALGLHKTDKRIFLADLGTNGELVLSDRGKLFCTSTAAGPALEGACIECGMGGVSGAIDKVYIENGEIRYTVIGSAEPVGICGAGITDAVALLVSEGKVDSGGYMEEDFQISQNVRLTAKDIRQFQLAKSAVYSGIETLNEVVGIENSEVDTFCIAGGLGYYINPESAFTAGLLPKAANVKAVGNTSLLGALMCIGHSEAVEKMRKISKECTLVDLGGNPKFSERFMNNMFFDEE